MREYGFSLTRILPYSHIFYAVNVTWFNLRLNVSLPNNSKSTSFVDQN